MRGDRRPGGGWVIRLYLAAKPWTRDISVTTTVIRQPIGMAGEQLAQRTGLDHGIVFESQQDNSVMRLAFPVDSLADRARW